MAIDDDIEVPIEYSTKRGSTFRIRVPFEAGLKGMSHRCQVKAMGSGSLVADLNVREIDVAGVCLLELEGPTDDWPVTILSADVQSIEGNEVIHSHTILIRVLRNVTSR